MDRRAQEHALPSRSSSAPCALYLTHDETKRARDYWLALALFAAALLCKISVVFFPFVILLHAWWKRDRLTLADAKPPRPSSPPRSPSA